jgi:hypothetical protein
MKQKPAAAATPATPKTEPTKEELADFRRKYGNNISYD